MRDFDAVIARDGTVYHLAWANHLQTVAHFGIPENKSEWRQNYFEYDIRAPFTEGLGLQSRGIEDPPEPACLASDRSSAALSDSPSGSTTGIGVAISGASRKTGAMSSSTSTRS